MEQQTHTTNTAHLQRALVQTVHKHFIFAEDGLRPKLQWKLSDGFVDGLHEVLEKKKIVTTDLRTKEGKQPCLTDVN